ncbi:hypothetical protein [Micromonospora auratinigra]|uniref:WD40-like Beta Propeller Repeat n=1 Tax=Micromonospora auratinigra TaxID=261654 RepID=A0A1A9ABJ3_9ACTN|nr:hypothetical protein [Micromonospora auratinigra]SBT53523.1 hypothetical protein GA0070611_6167 [Micromonospora auratinigra]
MRHAVSSVTIALGLIGAVVAPAGLAAAAPAAAPVQAATPKKKCTVEDKRLRELSGLVATKTGYVVINDGTEDERLKKVFFLDSKCQLAREPVSYSGAGPLDTEDLALSPDGATLWIADTGDNITSKTRRERVAVWSMPLNGGKRPVLHRLAYPEKKPHDAEALLIGDDNLPLVITKDPSGKAEIFKPDGALRSGDTEPVPMKKVGEVTVPKTTTDNKLGAPGRLTVTGAARSPDGSRVVLRTYADAFEYPVTNGDIVAALTNGKPNVTPLADPFGEAISYTVDGRAFVTVSDAGLLDADEPVEILSYVPSTKGVEALPAAGGDLAKPAGGKSWYDDLSLDQITYLIAAVGVLGALMVGAGIFGIMRARKKPAPPAESDDRPEHDSVFPNDGGFPPAGNRPDAGPPPGGARGGVYGGSGGVYGGGSARPPAGGGVYGGRPQDGGARGSGVYGGQPGGGGRPPQGGGPQRGGGRPPQGAPGGGGRPPQAAPGGGGPQRGGGRPPQGGGVYGGGPQGGGGYGGGPQGGGRGAGRAEPPRRDPGQGDPRGRRGDGGYDDRGQYGPVSGGREYRGDRY